jgi:hypothetical protein
LEKLYASLAKPSRAGLRPFSIVLAPGLRKTGIMSNDIDDRTTDYRDELAQCDRDDRAAENAEMCAPALILVSAAVAVASFTAHQTIGLTLGIIGVIAGFVWRSDLKTKSISRTERRSSLRRALRGG